MSVRSMTGYGSGAASRDGTRVTVELKSVNHRQLDLRISLPRSIQTLEPKVREVVSATIERGAVAVEISLSLPPEIRRSSVRVDADLAAAYVSAIREAAREFDIDEDISASWLLDIPDVATVVAPDIDEAQVWRLVNRALTSALSKLSGMRREEGRSLAKDLRQRLLNMREAVKRIEQRVPITRKEYRDNLRRRVEEAVGTNVDNDERLAREVVYYAERADITEELVRLKSHHSQASGLLRLRSPAGRPLDFLAQEMFREVNTIASKAADGLVIAEVVSIKTELERLREQLRNIE